MIVVPIKSQGMEVHTAGHGHWLPQVEHYRTSVAVLMCVGSAGKQEFGLLTCSQGKNTDPCTKTAILNRMPARASQGNNSDSW